MALEPAATEALGSLPAYLNFKSLYFEFHPKQLPLLGQQSCKHPCSMVLLESTPSLQGLDIHSRHHVIERMGMDATVQS